MPANGVEMDKHLNMSVPWVMIFLSFINRDMICGEKMHRTTVIMIAKDTITSTSKCNTSLSLFLFFAPMQYPIRCILIILHNKL